MKLAIYSWFSRRSTARGSCTGLVTVGPKTLRYKASSVNKRCVYVSRRKETKEKMESNQWKNN